MNLRFGAKLGVIPLKPSFTQFLQFSQTIPGVEVVDGHHHQVVDVVK
jgi:hypothetical protein